MEQKKEERMLRNEDSVRGLWNSLECTQICIMGVPEDEGRERKGLR